jgi:hypothetical protein
VLEVGERQQIELVQGAAGSEMATITLIVDDVDLWKSHFESQGIAIIGTSSGLEVAGPGGLTVRFE